MKVSFASFVVRCIAWLTALVFTALLGCFVFLSTPYGRSVLVSALNDKLQDDISIGATSGFLFSDVTFTDIRVKDPKGEWLAVDRLRVSWHPFALLTGASVFQDVSASRVDVLRLPDYPPSTEAGDQTSFSWNDIKPYIPRRIQVGEAVLEQGILRERKSVSLSWEVQQDFSHDVYKADVTTVEGPETSLHAVFKPALASLSAEAAFHEAPGGIVAGLLRFPEEATLDLNVVLSTDAAQDIRIDKAVLQLGATEASLQGRVNLKAHKAVLHGTASAELREWQKLIGAAADGKLKAEIDANGPFGDLQTAVSLTSDELTIDKDGVKSLAANASGRIDLSDLSRIGFDAKGEAAGDWIHDETYGVKMSYAAKGTQDDFAFETVADIGTADGEAHLEARGNAQPSEQVFAVTADAAATHMKNAFEAHLQAAADAQEMRADAFSLKGPGLEVTAQGVRKNALLTGQATIRISDLSPLAAMLRQQMKGKMDADLAFGEKDAAQTVDATIRALDVTYQDKTVRLSKPLTAAYHDDALKVSPFELQALNGTLSGYGSADKDALDASFRFRSLRLDPFLSAYDAKARVDGSLRLTGSPANPVASADVSIDASYEAKPVKAALKGTWQANDLKTSFQASSNQAQVKGDASLKTGLSLFPFKTDLSAETSVDGRAALTMPLTTLNPFLWATRQTVEGLLSGTATVKGTIGAPHVAGNFQLQKAAYRHMPSGVCLENIRADIAATPEKVVLTSLSAKNGGGGTLSGKASLGLTGAQKLDGALRFDRLKLFCGGMAEGIVDGSLHAQGDMTSNSIGGKLKLSPLNIQLPGAQSEVNIPQIETVRLRSDRRQEAQKDIRTRLDIALDAPNQVFIRGRGLDAEFGGNVLIRGFLTDPDISGQFQSRRGKFTFFDRNLALDKAVLRFQGPIPPSPFLDVQASTTVQEKKIGINLTGPAAKPSVVLSSQPTLPQDEILALFLFGRELAKITPFQALRLARAVRSLSGQDGGEPGVLDKARSAIGLDTLDVDTDDQNNVTVSTGKYVTDKVFVGVQQGAKPEDKKLKTEIELRPSVTANTTVDAQGNQGVGIGWRYDY